MSDIKNEIRQIFYLYLNNLINAPYELLHCYRRLNGCIVCIHGLRDVKSFFFFKVCSRLKKKQRFHCGYLTQFIF